MHNEQPGLLLQGGHDGFGALDRLEIQRGRRLKLWDAIDLLRIEHRVAFERERAPLSILSLAAPLLVANGRLGGFPRAQLDKLDDRRSPLAAPDLKDVSAVFAGGDQATCDAVVQCVQDAAKTALAYAETAAVTRHGHAGRIKQFAEAAIAACYSHFSSRVGEPQLHVHGFFFNLGKRRGSNEWSALEHRAQFDRKMATGILFRVELASRLRGLGFDVEPAGPYFTIRGIEQSQRDALSTRSKQIAEYVKECGMLEVDGAVAREIAALNTRSAKAEPRLPELLASFEKMAASIGLTPETVAAMRVAQPKRPARTPRLLSRSITARFSPSSSKAHRAPRSKRPSR